MLFKTQRYKQVLDYMRESALDVKTLVKSYYIWSTLRGVTDVDDDPVTAREQKGKVRR
jgi:hypothetical protein